MAQHKQMAITQFKHKYQQIYLERTHTTEHQTPSSITQNFTHISSWRIIKTIQFWVKENQKRKRVPSVLLAGNEYDRWRRSGGFGLVWNPKTPCLEPNPQTHIKSKTRRGENINQRKLKNKQRRRWRRRIGCALLPTMVAELMRFQAFRPGLDFTEKWEPKSKKKNFDSRI